MEEDVGMVYRGVVDSVVENVRDAFVEENVESVLGDLEGLWRSKLVRRGIMQYPEDRCFSGGPDIMRLVNRLNIPYEGTEVYEAPASNVVFPPIPIELSTQPPLLVGSEQNQCQPPHKRLYHRVADTNTNMRPQMLDPFMNHISPSIDQQHPGSYVDVASGGHGNQEWEGFEAQAPANLEIFTSGKRKRDDIPSYNFFPSENIPQHDGSADAFAEQNFHQEDLITHTESNAPDQAFNEANNTRKRNIGESVIALGNMLEQHTATIPQHDGLDDDCKSVVKTDDCNAPWSNENNAEDAQPPENGAALGYESSLNEDDDDDDDDTDVDELDVGNYASMTELVLTQFDKVSRTKNRWKCSFRDGMMHVNDRDILFSQATCELEF